MTFRQGSRVIICTFYPYLVKLRETILMFALIRHFLRASARRILEALQFIAAETERRGLDFQLAIWTHAYEWTASPNSKTIRFWVSRLQRMLPIAAMPSLSCFQKLCPQIKGVTLAFTVKAGSLKEVTTSGRLSLKRFAMRAVLSRSICMPKDSTKG